MSIFRNVVFIAAVAGLFAGLVLAVLQTVYTSPLIIAAEAFEGGDEAEPAAEGADAHASEGAHDHEAGGHHDDEAWMPADGAERTFYTVAANVVTGIGFALLLVAVSEIAGGIGGWREGLLWGFGGFAAFTLAPGLGLPPELPGMPAADLVARQVWWTATVVMTAGGIALIAFSRNAMLAVLGAALIIAPHVIGAPQPDSHDSAVPADLHHSFVVAVTVTNLVFWLALGAAVGVARNRFAAGLGAPQAGLA